MPTIPTSMRAPLITAGGIFGGSMLGTQLAKSKPSPLEQQQLDRANQAGQRGMDTSQNLFDMGMPATRQPIDYWSSILSGDRSRMASAMGPELSRIGEGYQQAAKTSAALNPRGGPTPDFLSQQPYNQQRDVSTMFQQARPQAADKLAGTGSNLMANSINALYSSTAAGRDVLNFESQRRDRERQAGEGFGKTIYDLFYPANGQPGLASSIGDIFKAKPGAVGGAAAGGAAATGGAAAASALPAAGGATLGAGALSAIPGVGTAALPGTLAAPSAAGLGAAAPATGLTGALGLGGGAGMFGLGAATIPVVGGIIAGGALLANHFIGQGRKAADKLTGEGGIQHAFEDTLQQIDAQPGYTPEQKWQSKLQAYSKLQELALQFAQKGSNERKVATQMFDMIAPLFGKPNPLRGAV